MGPAVGPVVESLQCEVRMRQVFSLGAGRATGPDSGPRWLPSPLSHPTRRNGGCTFIDSRACLAGWPNLAADPAVTAYYQLELAWYLHM